MGKAKTPEEKAAAKTAKGADIVDVIDANGTVMRSYSEEQQGEDFRAHADEFASKAEGRKVVGHAE